MADERPLESLRWQSRVVVVLAGASDDALLEEQSRLLDVAAAGLQERDIVVVKDAAGAVTIDDVAQPGPTGLRDAYGAPSSGFQVLLIGKDGGVKLRSGVPVGADELFALIDTMPMRRREMQERN
jgi:hypothetical protein